MIVILAALTTFFLIFYNLVDAKARVKDKIAFFIASLLASSTVATFLFTNTLILQANSTLFMVGVAVVSVGVLIHNTRYSSNLSSKFDPNHSLAVFSFQVIELNKNCQRVAFWLKSVKNQQVLLWHKPLENHLNHVRKLEQELVGIEQQIGLLMHQNKEALKIIKIKLKHDTPPDIQYITLQEQLENNLRRLPIYKTKAHQLKHLLHLAKTNILRQQKSHKLSDKAIATIEKIAAKGQQLWNAYDELTEDKFWKKYNHLISQTKQV